MRGAGSQESRGTGGVHAKCAVAVCFGQHWRSVRREKCTSKAPFAAARGNKGPVNMEQALEVRWLEANQKQAHCVLVSQMFFVPPSRAEVCERTGAPEI